MRRGCFISRIMPVFPAACLLLATTSMAMAPCEEGFKSKKKTLYDNIDIYFLKCKTPIFKAYVLEVDLTSKKTAFFVTPYKQRRLVTSKFAERFDALVAVNGGFWNSEGGFTVSRGEKWPKYDDTEEGTVVGFGGYDAGNKRVKIDIRPTEEILNDVPDGMKYALTGMPLILDDGEVKSSKHKIFGARHPRTGLGYTKDKKTLFIIVVDGRQGGWSWGLRTSQFGQLFKSLGAHRALNLDGGASSTMVIPKLGGLVNKTCFKKGPERNVPNHLGIIKAAKDKKTASFMGFFEPLYAAIW